MPEFLGRLRTPRLAAPPSSPVPGEVYYDTVLKQLLYWDGTQWSQGTASTVYDSDYVGTVKAFAGPAVPTNWMLCDGRSLAAASYPDLFNVLGYKYGGSSGNFNLPDLRSKFIYGVAQADLSDLGDSGGQATVVLSVGQLPSHNHGGTTGDDSPDHSHSGSTNTAGSHQHVKWEDTSSPPMSMIVDWPGSIGGTVLTGQKWGTSTSGVVGTAPNQMDAAAGSHAHTVSTVGASVRHQHSIPTAGSDQAHENLPPYIRLVHIIKVTGAQINAGGALVGPTGPSGAKGDPGPWRGPWAAATAYAVGDSVSYFDGTVTASYRRKVAGTTAGNPKTDTTNWEIIASGGSIGAPGTVPVYEQPGMPSDTTVGAIWIDTDDVAPVWTQGIPLVSSLPGSPVDGQEVYLLVDATNGVIWRLRYRAGSSSAYKWEFVGGPPMMAAVDTTQTTSSTTYVDLATVGPQLTAPRAGDYQIEHGFDAFPNLANAENIWASVKLGAAAIADAEGTYVWTNAANMAISASRIIQRTLAASDVVKQMYKLTAGGSQVGNFRWRYLRLLPVRLS